MAITDKFSQVSTSNTARPAVSLLDAPGKALAASSINITDATNWDDLVHFAIYNKTADGRKDVNSQTDWKATRSGTTLSNLTLTGGTDQAYTAGAIVELTPTYRYAKDLYDGLTVAHDDTGALLPTAVDAAILPGSLDTAQHADGSITTAKIASEGWQTFVPTWNNLTIGNAVVTAKYIQSGKNIRGFIKVVFGTTSVMGASPTFSAPVTAASQYATGNHNVIGSGYAEDAGAAALNAFVSFNASAANISLLTMNTAGTYGNLVPFGASIPLAWNTGDFFNATFEYEAA